MLFTPERASLAAVGLSVLLTACSHRIEPQLPARNTVVRTAVRQNDPVIAIRDQNGIIHLDLNCPTKETPFLPIPASQNRLIPFNSADYLNIEIGIPDGVNLFGDRTRGELVVNGREIFPQGTQLELKSRRAIFQASLKSEGISLLMACQK